MKKNLFISIILTTGLLLLALAAPFTHPALASPNAATDDFVITVKTDNWGVSTDTQFTIPTTGTGYNYNVDCDDNGSDEATGQTGDYTCMYGAAGTYTVRIKDNTGAGTGFPRIYFGNAGDSDKLLAIEQWGTGKWTSMTSAFSGCTNLTVQAIDNPDLSNVTNMSGMFFNASTLNFEEGAWVEQGNITTNTVGNYTWASGDVTGFSPFLMAQADAAPTAVTLQTISAQSSIDLTAVVLGLVLAVLTGFWGGIALIDRFSLDKKRPFHPKRCP